MCFFFFFQAEDGIRDWSVTGVQTCALPISSSSSGRTALPPSHPHAATSDAVPAPAASRNNARRSIMRREAAPIPAGDHGPQRRGIDDEDQQHVDDQKARENPHGPEVPVARRLKSSEQRREPR